MKRLMSESGLVRDKWQREDYLPRTILKACAQQKEVYSTRRRDTATPSTVPPPEPVVDTLNSQFTTGYQYMTCQQQVEYFKNMVYVAQHHAVWVPNGALLKPDQFKAVYGGYLFSMDNQNDKTSKNAWEVFTQSQGVRFPKVDNICFRPELPPGEIVEEEGLRLVNIYVPIETPSQEGDVTPFIEHMEKLLPDERDREIVMTYCAALVQNPGVKFQWCPLIQGVEGNGKTLISRCIAEAVGHRYTHLPNASDLAGNGIKFNAWCATNLFVAIEDIYVNDRREVTEALKPFISNSRIEIQPKGGNQYTGDNRSNWLMFTNHKDAMQVTFDTRRYCVLYTAQQSKSDKIHDGMGGDYFPELYRWLRGGGYACVTHYLKNYKLDERFNPAGNCQEAPMTTSTHEAVQWSLGAVEQQIIEAIDEGKPGFAGGWISSKAVDRLLKDMKMDGRIHINRRRPILQSLGYDWHPALPAGRCNNLIAQEQGKPKIYCRTDDVLKLQLDTSQKVIARYMQDQGYLSVDEPVSTGVDSVVKS